ncbi:hypothetical protein P9112_000851 [Eukaryota sp. TZLM1-RC]
MDSFDHLRATFHNFLSSPNGRYLKEIGTLLEQYKTRLIVDLRHLRDFDPQVYTHVLQRPLECIPHFEAALNSIIETEYASLLSRFSAFGKVTPKFNIGFSGAFGASHATPRSLSAQHIHKLICLEGVVARASPVLPLPRQVKHYCPNTKKWHVRSYPHPLFSGPMSAFGGRLATKDAENNPLTQEFGLSEFTDAQLVTVQEAPELLPPGQLPRSVECLLLSDLADAAPVGSRVLIGGVLRLLHSSTSNPSSSAFPTILIGVSIQVLDRDAQQPKFTASDLALIKQLASRPDIFTFLSQSVAPSIFGHTAVKKGLLLMLASGVEHSFGSSRIRGDINVLLIGDPATAKSQLLRYTLRTVSIGISASGRGASSAGLTAAVVPDTFASSHLSSLGVAFEKRLEAGALVLADRGVCVIDEFDKLDDGDRGVLHEAMEQQTVSIAKAGIQATLNARASILAAANPLFNVFDPAKNLSQNIGVPESLLSRFDLVFVIRGGGDATSDSKIASHVLKIHQDSTQTTRECHLPVVPKSMEEGQTVIEEDNQIDFDLIEEELNNVADLNVDLSAMFEKDIYNNQVVSQDFLKKYLFYVKSRFTPRLDPDAAQFAIDFYCELRAKYEGSRDEETNSFAVPITPRSLETLFRLASAHAKLRWSKVVEVEDVEVAIEVASEALNSPFTNFYSDTTPNREAGQNQSESRHRTRDRGSESVKQARVDYEDDVVDFVESISTPSIEAQSNQLSESRYEEFKELMFSSRSIRKAKTRNRSLEVERFVGLVNQNAPVEFTDVEAELALNKLQEEEILVVRDGEIYFIEN